MLQGVTRPQHNLRDIFTPKRPSERELRWLLAQKYDQQERFEIHERLWSEVESRHPDAANSSAPRLSESDRGYQIHVAWRLTRLHMLLTGRLSRHETLDDPLDRGGGLEPAEWIKPQRIASRIRGLTLEEKVGITANEQRWAELTADPLPFLPPQDEERLAPWMAFYEHLAVALLQPEAPPAFAYATSRSVISLLEDPLGQEEGNLPWPSIIEIIRHEAHVFAATRKECFADRIDMPLPDWIANHWGLNLMEIVMVTKGMAAFEQAVENLDIDERRALQAARWAGVRKRARSSGDVRAEAVVNNRIDNIYGLNRGETGDINGELVQLVKLNSVEPPKPPKLRAAPPPSLPAARVLEKDDDDAIDAK